jgi:Potential Queuosine, Q, salvage protein family
MRKREGNTSVTTFDAGRFDDDETSLYSLPEPDPLGILSSTRTVVEQGELVWINDDQVELLADAWHHEQPDITSNSVPVWYDRYHFFDGTERTVNWLLLLDALNFCFWAKKDQTRWTIEYQGETLNGYWAEAAALTRAVEEGLPLWDAAYLSTISAETMAHIFRGQGTIPLFEHRIQHAREVGRVLLERYQGQFTQAILESEHNAIKLVQLLVKYFSSFRDVASYRTHQVNFYKRAQICIADLHGAFAGQQWGAFSDLEHLTIFADYKLPQVLRHYNILEYDTALAQRVDNQELLVPNSEEEVEIRAATVWAGELLRRAMQRRGQLLTSAEIDQRLWLAGQQSDSMHPYHRTRTIYY